MPHPHTTPPLHFPDELPICAHRHEIAQAITNNRVIIICGDTGSGKTTQLPKIALAAHRGQNGLIGITQPRRLAALAMADRVAQELGGKTGEFVGVQHRFDKRLSPQTRVKFMTDGILLAETRHDPLLRAYDTIIIDEAHERSLNIDFLLGILRTILPRRPDLRVIISSATLDMERFAHFFTWQGQPAPMISIPGRLYPVTLRYLPPMADQDDDDPDLPRLIANAIDTINQETKGDILVFLPGERDIRDTTELLNGRNLPHTAIIPLLASLPAGEQQRAFKTIPGIQRIILATNVAETSLTLPGIRVVIDSGLARLPRWNPRNRVQRLQIEPISQASANQRAGRCGRIGPGICLRLYSEENFHARPQYTDPEIVRSSLAGVILTMLDLRLGNISHFPFLNPPPPTTIRDGWRELHELGAITTLPDPTTNTTPRLTPIGHRLAALPIDPRFARILIAADREQALASALIVVAALECDDPRRRPVEKQTAADTAHARFLTPNSDFSATLKLWRWYTDNNGFSSNTAARNLCRNNFLSFPKMRDWHDLHQQLQRLTTRIGLNPTSNSGAETGLHRALLTGLLSNIGKFNPDDKTYRGAHGLQFTIFPGSGLAKTARTPEKKQIPPPPRQPTSPTTSRTWIIAGELVETSRLFARTVACIDPSWIEPLAGHLCKYSYHSPWWDAKNGFARIRTRVTLFGLLLSENRPTDYSRIDPGAARDLFIRHGLINGEFPKPPPLISANTDTINKARRSAEKQRHHDYELEDKLYTFFQQHLPADIFDANSLRRRLRREPHLATLLLLNPDTITLPTTSATDFPDTLTLSHTTLPLTYCHAPGTETDGITCTVTTNQLPLLRAWHHDWLVPGFLPDKVRWLLSALPSKSRALLTPLADTTTRILALLKPGREPLNQALAKALYQVTSLRLPPDTWDETTLPNWLRIHFVITDHNGDTIATGRDLNELLIRFAPVTSPPTTSPTPNAATPFQRHNITSWDFGTLPTEIDLGQPGIPIIHYPALTDSSSTTCALRLFPDPHTAATAHQQGTTRLIALTLGPYFKTICRPLPIDTPLRQLLTELDYTPDTLATDIALAAIKATFLENRPPIRDATSFNHTLTQNRAALSTNLNHIRNTTLAILHEVIKIEQHLTNHLATPVVPPPPPKPLPRTSSRPADRKASLATFADLLNAANRGALDSIIPTTTSHPVATTPQLPPTATSDITDQLAWLIFPSFVSHTPWSQLQHYPRYLQAIHIRIERLRTNPAADTRRLAELTPLWQRYTQFATNPAKPPHNLTTLSGYRWLIEEYRVSLFAQELRTATPASPQRLNKLWQTLLI
ncbi:MAG: ATP-dependent RNA helicase HrpA [Lentisphaerae bacterium]|nr:ATP-dependent RNA helicase HrpA [Lentisphaerota bacterium]